jgi:thiol-disulfide isomerase/thioredoxin
MKLLFFKAPWCSVCHSLAPHVPDYAEHVDAEEQPDVADRYGITTLPLFIAVDEAQKEIARIQTTSIPALTYWFNKLQEAI